MPLNGKYPTSPQESMAQKKHAGPNAIESAWRQQKAATASLENTTVSRGPSNTHDEPWANAKKGSGGL